MPLVTVTARRDIVTQGFLSDLTEALPLFVAEALHVSENEQAHLAPEHVEVQVFDLPRLNANAADIGIVVIANKYPERMANMDARKEMMAKRLFDEFQNEFRDLSVSLWLLLVDGAFAMKPRSKGAVR